MSGQKGLTQQSKSNTSTIEVLNKGGQESSPSKKFVRPEFSTRTPESSNKTVAPKAEFTRLFDATSHREDFENKSRIENLLSQIRREVAVARVEGSSISAELNRIDNATMQPVPNKVGIYHIAYYEKLLEYAMNFRRKLSASMWSSAMSGKQKAKRGSAFASAKSSTDSPEASVARSSN